MPIPRSLLDGIDTSGQQAPDRYAVPEPDQGPQETPTSYVVRKGTSSFGEGIGRAMNAGQALSYGESLPFAAMRLFLPKEWVDKISPYSKIPVNVMKGDKNVKTLGAALSDYSGPGKDIGAQAGSNLVNDLGGKAPDQPDIGAAPGPISNNLGNASSFVGAALAQPFPPGVSFSKYLMSIMGTAELASLGGDAARVTTKAVGGSDEAAKLAEIGGNFAGGVIGSPANVIRMNAISSVAKAPYMAAKNGTAAAVSAARKAWTDESGKGFFSYLSDDYSHLRDEAKGAIQKRVITDVANDIRMDPDAPEAMKAFDEAATKAGVNVDQFNIGQRSSTPSLVGTISQLRPKTPEETSLIANKNKASQQEIIEASKRVSQNTVDLKANSVLNQLKDYQKTTDLRIQGLNDEAKAVADTTPMLSPEEKFKQGENVYQLYEKELATARNEKNRLYGVATDLANAQGVDYDVSKAVGQIKDVLKSTMSKINPSVSPNTLTNLKNVFGGKKAIPELADVLEQMGMTAPEVSAPTKLSDINDAVVALNDDIRSAARGTDSASRIQVSNLSAIRKSLEGIIQDQSPPEVINAYNEAVKHFKDVYIPRFREGTNYNLSREKGPMGMGERKIDPMGVIGEYLKPEPNVGQVSETRMREFDNLFGGVLPGTERSAEAYNELWKGIQDKYASKLLTGKEKFDPIGHEKFINDYQPALDRVPALRTQLEDNANKIMDLQAEAGRVSDQYKAVSGAGSLGATLGPENAANVVSKALADPRKMGQLISALNKGEKAGTGEGTKALVKEIMYRATPWRETPNGLEYNPEKLIALLDSGKANADSVGGLQVAFRAAFGREAGDSHLDNLRAIALLAQRQALTNPRFLRPQEPFPEDMFKNVTGQTAASWITSFKAMAEGRVSDTYFASIGFSKFFNTRVKAAFTEAQQKALFDPEMSKAILELAATPANQPMNKGPIQKVLGSLGDEGSDFVKRLVEHGMIKQHMFNAARVITAVKANEDQSSPSKRERFNNEPYINRMEK